MILKNEELALKSIGGLKSFGRVVHEKRSLLLKLQPENEYHAGIFNDKTKPKNTVHMVFKFQKNKRTGAVRAVCLGQVQNTYTFSSMADFQYLPLAKLPGEEECFQDLVPRIVPQNLTDALCWWDRPDVDDATKFFLPSFIFSRYTKPINRLMTPEELPNNEDVNLLLAENRRLDRKRNTMICQGTDEFPGSAPENIVKEVDQTIKSKEAHDLVSKMFESRPVWTRPAILIETGLDDGLLKALLPKFAFYIVSGPFGRCWCRYGYDPRKEPSGKAYQTISVSFRFNDHIPEKMRLRIASASSSAKAYIPAGPVDYRFRPSTLPNCRQMWYCVMDILLPVAEEVMRTDMTQVVKDCDPAHGWLPAEVIETLRESIKADVAQTMTAIREAEPDIIPEDMQYYDEGTLEDIF